MFPAAYSALDASPLPDGCATILRLLAASSPNWPEIALVAARDPVMCLALLTASPVAVDELDAGLNTVLRQRLERLGPDLLRAWMLGVGRCPPPRSADAEHALLVAECALHLALETRYPRPDEAYLGGLWRSLAEQVYAIRDGGSATGTADGRQKANSRQDFSRLVCACGLSAALCDALEFGTTLDEQLQGAHPLVRLLRAAGLLAAQDWQARIAEVAALTGLTTHSLVSLRTDVAYIVSGHAVYPPADAEVAADGTALVRVANGPFRDAAMLGLLNAAFADLEPEQIAERLEIAAPFFGLAIAPVLLAGDDAGLLRPLLPCAPASPAALIDELGLRMDDESSCIALAARCGQPTSHIPAGATPRRSTSDWHVARWLGHHGFCCLPLTVDGSAVVGLVATGHEQPSATIRELLAGLLGAAARAIRSARRHREDAATRETALQQRFRDHVRRIAHEATNPLTVIKSRLDLLGQQRGGDMPLQNEMVLLNAELDRIDNLLRRAADLPVQVAEVPRCSVTELLLDMRAVYGDALFASHGIGFELRAAKDLPPAAIPASALKQVLLNLFRNASEALQPGKRLTVSVVGQVIIDGRTCLELRLVDNGPGLPPDRVADLFAPRSSTKGGGHQGVGLAVVRDILAQWKAVIVCRSQPGSGTSFQIFVPLDQTA